MSFDVLEKNTFAFKKKVMVIKLIIIVITCNTIIYEL